MLDAVTLKTAMPKQYKGSITQDLLDSFNSRLTDATREMSLENVVTFNNVLVDGKYSTKHYLDVITYVSHKLCGLSNTEAWKLTFPDRYKRCKEQNRTAKDLSSYVSNFHNRPLVSHILSQVMIPAHVSYAQYFHESIKKHVDLMRNADKERTQLDAAISLANILKAPEDKKLVIDVGVATSSALEDLKVATAALALQQQQMIENKIMTAKDAAHQNIITEGEYERIG